MTMQRMMRRGWGYIVAGPLWVQATTVGIMKRIMRRCGRHPYWTFIACCAGLALYYTVWVFPAQGGMSSPDLKPRGLPRPETSGLPQPLVLPTGDGSEARLRLTEPAPPADTLMALPKPVPDASLPGLPQRVTPYRWVTFDVEPSSLTVVIWLKEGDQPWRELTRVAPGVTTYAYYTTSLGQPHCWFSVPYEDEHPLNRTEQRCLTPSPWREVQVTARSK